VREREREGGERRSNRVNNEDSHNLTRKKIGGHDDGPLHNLEMTWHRRARLRRVCMCAWKNVYLQSNGRF
jgi:hypothetical protein